MDVNSAILLHSVMMMQTRVFTVQVKRTIFIEISNISLIVFSFCSACVFWMSSSRLEWNQLLIIIQRVFKLSCLEQVPQKSFLHIHGRSITKRPCVKWLYCWFQLICSKGHYFWYCKSCRGYVVSSCRKFMQNFVEVHLLFEDNCRGRHKDVHVCVWHTEIW